MNRLIHSTFFLVFILIACTKKDKNTVTETPPVVVIPIDTGESCKDLPPTPKPFGWQDTLTDEEKNVNTFFYNPASADEIIYVVNGTIFGGFDKLYKYHIPTQTSILLGYNLNYSPDLNQLGWLVYSDVNSDIWKVKINGDSLTQFSNNQISDNPRWDYSGKYIYFFQKAKDNIPSQIVKADLTGVVDAVFPAELARLAPFNKSDKVIYLKIKNTTQVNLIVKDFENLNETILIGGPLEISPGNTNFNNLCLDNDDENLYWSNSIGVFSCNLASLKIDTLFKNCENMIYDRPIVSSKPHELYVTQQIKKPLSVFKLYHQYKAIEYNLISKQSSEVKIFP